MNVPLPNPAHKRQAALRLVKTTELNRDDWLAVRRTGIGGSDAAAAVGLNPYKSQLELWLEKTGRDAELPKPDPNDTQEPVYWGTLLEPIVAAAYTQQTGRRVRKVNAVLRHPTVNAIVGDEDELGSFIFRTTSYNSIRALAARLHYFSAVSGNLLACLPLELKLRGKSTTQSYRSAIYYVDLGVRSGSTLEETLTQARELDGRRKASGFDQTALDAAARLGFANGAFEDSPDEATAIADEFYPDASERAPEPDEQEQADAGLPTLHDKLDRKAAQLRGAAA